MYSQSMNIPENLQYTTDHEWVLIDGNKAKVGITDYAQDALGDVVFIDIPEIIEIIKLVPKEREKLLTNC